MFLKDWDATLVKNTKTIELICSNCNNKTEHLVAKHPYGIMIGFIFSKEPLLSKYKYYLVCPICGNFTKELSKDELIAVKK